MGRGPILAVCLGTTVAVVVLMAVVGNHGTGQVASGQYMSSTESGTSTIPMCFQEPLAPYIQARQGLSPEEVVCKDGLVLATRENGAPLCIREESVGALLRFGWAVGIPDAAKPGNTWNPQSKPHDERVYCNDELKVEVWSGTEQNIMAASLSPASNMAQSASATRTFSAGDDSLGLAVGGAQDINNFRANVENDYLPLHTDITYEGLFYDYYFDTGRDGAECDALFCPSYSYAASTDPFSGELQYYLSVGLNSGLKESDFERKDLNLVIVLDVSESMGTPFDRYHYDDPFAIDPDTHSKMQIAAEAVAGLVDHLGPDDNLGVVLFNSGAHLAKPLESMESTDLDRLKANIMAIYADGGTNMDAGMNLGTSLFGGEMVGYENRIIFLTDAMPNLGDITRGGLLKTISDNSKSRIHTTFIGIGIDLNTELVEALTKVRGANYYSVHSATEFKSRMVDEFELMVTPLVFDLELRLDADGYEIAEVYGSPEADQATGEIMKVSTLFPSRTEDGQTRGGIVLLKLERVSDDAVLVLRTTYESVGGEPGESRMAVGLNPHDRDYHENIGVWKGVLLARYADLMKAWILDERAALAEVPVMRPSFDDDGILVPDHAGWILGPWERQSAPLQVSDHYKGLIAEFRDHFDEQAAAIGDWTLQQELEVLDKLAGYGA